MRWLLFLALPLLAFFGWWETSQHSSELRVSNRIIVPAVMRFGVNLGTWTAWGAEQLSANVVKNPGFEGIVDRAIAIPQSSGDGSFDDAPSWLARPDGFWDGARFDIRTGPFAGKQGTIAHSSHTGLLGLPSFVVRETAETPQPGEAVSLTKESADTLPTQWWFAGSLAAYSPAPGEIRPASPGTRSLRLVAAGSIAEVDSYMDAIGGRAGKLLPLEGEWKLSFWTRLEKGQGSLKVNFGRDGSSPLLRQVVPLTNSWRNVEFTFHAGDDGPPGNVALRFQVSGAPIAQVLLDDVDLRQTRDAGFPFRQEVISALQKLRPKYLRDWQGQLGDTLANRIAPAFARKAYRYRPGEAAATDYGYGLRDFLDLSRKVGADPWIIIPTTFSDEECAGLGTYLKQQPDITDFKEIVLEYGNENWNELFRPAGIPDAHLHGQAAGRCLTDVKQHAGQLPLKLTINAQHANPAAAASFAQEAPAADMEAVAPYFLPDLDQNTSLIDGLHQLFAGDGGRVKAILAKQVTNHKELAVYEVNLTTNGGTASGEQRLPIVAGAASGSALAKTMLDSLQLGVRRQCVYTLSQFDTQLPKDEGFVRLWGITRDLGPTRRFRPTGLALELMNRALEGDMYEVSGRPPKDVSVYAFRSRAGWAIALISASEKPEHIILNLPDQSTTLLPEQRLRLVADSIEGTNEDSERVRINRSPLTGIEQNRLTVDLAPWEFTVLLPRGERDSI